MLRFDGGRGFRMRLLTMGLNVGSVVEVIQGGRGGRGPTLIASGHTRLAIGHGIARKIIVAAEE